MSRGCSVLGCKARHNAQGYCRNHYADAREAGIITVLPKRSPEERFWAKVEKSAGCWEWRAATSNGYGRYSPQAGTNVAAHRYAWECVNGPIPEGLFACHTCDNRSCVRPDHIFLGTYSDNMRDMIGKGRGGGQFPKSDECHRGHSFSDPSNIQIITRADGSQQRRCRLCTNARTRKYRQAKKRAASGAES